MSLLDDLKAARALLSNSKRWTKGAFAKRTKRSVVWVSPFSVEATCWCLMGAIRKVTDDNDTANVVAIDALEECLPEIYHHFALSVFNDAQTTKHKDVMALLDCAIENAGR